MPVRLLNSLRKSQKLPEDSAGLRKEAVIRDRLLTLQRTLPADPKARRAALNLIEDAVSSRAAEQRSATALHASEERQSFLLRMSDALRPLADPLEIQKVAAYLLGAHLQANRVGYGEDEGDGEHIRVTQQYTYAVPGIAERSRYEDYVPLLAEFHAGRTVDMGDVPADPHLSDTEKQAYASLQLAATLNVPLMKSGRLVAVLFVHYARPHPFSAEEVTLVQEVAERIWAAVARAHSEASLIQSEERLRLALEATGMGAFRWHVEQDRSEIDARTREIFGLQPAGTLTLAEALGSVLHPEDRDRHAELMQRSLDPQGDGRLRSEFRIHRMVDGAERWVSVTGRTFFEGEPRRAVRIGGVVEDITERKETEMKLRAAADLDAFRVALGDVLRSPTDPAEIQMAAASLLGQWLKAGRALYAEVEPGDGSACCLVRQDYHLPGIPSMVGRHRAADFGAALFDQMKTGRTLVVADVSAEPGLTEQERMACLERGMACCIAVPLIKDGRHVAILSVIDLSARKWTAPEIEMVEETAERTWAAVERALAKEAVAADLRDTQLLRDLSTRLTSETDIHTLYEEVNIAARTLARADAGTVQLYDGASRELVMASAVGFPESRSRFDRVDAGSATSCGVALQTGERTFIDFDDPTLEDRDGDLRWHVEAGYLSAQSTPLVTRTGRPIGMLSTHWRRHYRPTERELRFIDLLARQAADLIERRAAEKAIRAAKEAAELANRSKDRFLAVLSHELRTPLTPVLMIVSAMQEEEGLSEDLKQNLDVIRRNIETETRLIDDLLDLTRLSSGKVALKRLPLDFNDAVREACTVCEPLAKERHIHIEYRYGPGIGKVSADPVRMKQVLWNVLKNAIKFTMSGGRIQVSTANLGNSRCEVRVRDNGIGIPPEALPHIFNAFEQGDSRITQLYGGLGLGLAITKALVEVHDGSIRAESAGSGAGSCFVMEFPVSRE